MLDTDTETGYFAVYSTIEADRVVDVPANTAYELEGIQQGRGHLITPEELDEMGDDVAQIAKSPEWSYECPAITMTVESAKAVSLRSFREWYPHYAEAHPSKQEQLDSVVVLCDITFANASDTETLMPSLALWADGFDGAETDFIGSGWQLNPGILAELYGVPQARENLIGYTLEDGWNMLAPAEEKTITAAFILPKRTVGASDDGRYDLTKLCITTWDCEPATTYRFWLPDATAREAR